MGETIAALKLAGTSNWKQLFFDGTTRRQKSFTALIIGLLDEDGEDGNSSIDPVVVSSCIFTEDETSENQAQGIIDKVSENASTRSSTTNHCFSHDIPPL